MKTLLALFLLMGMPGLLCARIIKEWSYQQMVDQSDLVVIAVPLDSKVTSEINELANIKVVGLSTEFKIRAVLKGERPNKLVLHHYRYRSEKQDELNDIVVDAPPNLVDFESQESNAFLLFLVREANGQCLIYGAAAAMRVRIPQLF